jgi:hypothetical protein
MRIPTRNINVVPDSRSENIIYTLIQARGSVHVDRIVREQAAQALRLQL